ncbi:MAG: ketopantoate reductase family protein [Prevotella sp.]|jgi:2-dehydropantoate 2-reductase|nr:ketopantoate reductase family protein [Prevotella sp.]
MKILIYGAGVIGCTYGWQLSKAGYDTTVLVRERKKEQIERDGINIHCTDFRYGKKKTGQAVFRPKVIDKLSPDNDFEYIIVSVRNPHLKEVLPVLKHSAGKANILFFMNILDFGEIDKYLSSKQYFVGFPFMVGGCKENGYINSIISGSKYSKTMLGELNGENSERVQAIASAMESAGMKPFVSYQIKNWLIPHGVFIAALSAGIIKAGGTMEAFIDNTKIVKDTIKDIRRGFQICAERGIDPRKEKVNKLYYLPLFISVPVVKKIFNDEVMRMMFDGYLKYSTEEVKKMLADIYGGGNLCNT